VIIALLVLSIWYTFQDDEIFGFVSYYGEKHIPEKLQQPVFACNVCMTPWWGSAIYWVLPWHHPHWAWYVVTVITAMGINAAINKLAPDK
jgi:hypothetical protein